MAFEQRFFEPVGGQARSGTPGLVGNSMALWDYRSSSDLPVAIRGSAYFDFLRDMVNKDDSVLIKGSSGAFEILFFDSVPKSPLTTAVTVSALKIVAA